jgi:UDP-N-acetylmuramoyl-tripeptide--D-alanyl-D-alanine ligase
MATLMPRNAAPFELDEIARATSGVAVGAASVRGVTTDSRVVGEGMLFVALRGERFDAHRFLGDVVRAGAAAAIVERGAAVPAGLPHVLVGDTLRALGDLARLHRTRWGGKVIGITGSVGKTTTKELCRAGLEGAGATVLATAGNLNNRIGVPMTLFGLTEAHALAVIEMGTSEPGEIARLAEIAGPDVGVVLHVAEAHTAGLTSLDAVADEKTALFRALGESGVIVANADDARIMARVPSTSARVITFGTRASADVQLLDWTLEGAGTRSTYRIAGATPFPLVLGLVGEAAAIDAAAALAAGAALGFAPDAMAPGLSRARPSPGRLEPKTGAADVLVLDDTYNANPRSMRVSLRTASAAHQKRGGRLLVVLGDMKELGDLSADAHLEVGRLVAEIAASIFVAVGAEMCSAAADEAERLGVDVRRAVDSAEAARVAQEVVGRGDLVLVKGSRSMRMEAVVDALASGAEATA